MNGHTTRRDFLGKAVAAGSCLVLPGMTGAAPVEASAGKPVVARADRGHDAALHASIVLIRQPVSRDVHARAGTWGYITEILDRAGMFFEELPPRGLPSVLRHPNRVVLLAGDLRLTSEQREALARWVEQGGSLIGIGGTSGLDAVFGVSGQRPLAEGWIEVTDHDHPVTAGLRSSLHVFGGYAVKIGSGASLAGVTSGKQGAKGSALVENRFGKGRALLLAPDLIFSIVHIQQGLPVFQDGVAAPDDSAPIDDGQLKAEDGMVLDWQRDRSPMQPDGVPVFLEPITDELREIILRSILHVALEQGVALAMLWYWPRGLKAVGHISHDTDGHDPQKAVALLDVMNRCGVKSTWCTLFPGGYPAEFYRTLKEQNFEIALHYDAMSGDERTSWSKENLVFQHRWLMDAAGLEHVASNKNHYTRWESRLDFFRWCEELGIESDQTRGPSKQGTIGFPLGGSQPYFPLDDETDPPRFLNVLEVNMLTQDLVVVCPGEYGSQLVDSVLRHHGVAHFLFHPAHILKPDVAEALGGLIDYGRAHGLEWWTNEQIYRWETQRRAVEATFDAPNALTLRAPKPLREATLLVLKPRQEPGSIRINGQPADGSPWTLYGFEFDAVTLDLSGETKVERA